MAWRNIIISTTVLCRIFRCSAYTYSDRGLSVVRLGYEHIYCYCCRMDESGPDDTTCACALL